MAATKMVNFAAIKLTYSGLIKEHYTKMVILNHPRFSNGEVGVYRINDVGDGLGIDYMLKNSNGIWNTVAVTNPNTTNNMCDIKFEFGKKYSIVTSFYQIHGLMYQKTIIRFIVKLKNLQIRHKDILSLCLTDFFLEFLNLYQVLIRFTIISLFITKDVHFSYKLIIISIWSSSVQFN